MSIYCEGEKKNWYRKGEILYLKEEHWGEVFNEHGCGEYPKQITIQEINIYWVVSCDDLDYDDCLRFCEPSILMYQRQKPAFEPPRVNRMEAFNEDW